MKSTGFNFGMTLTNDQLHPIMSSCVRQSNDEKSSPYGLYKIYDKSLGEYVGVQGMMILKDKDGKDLCTPNTNKPVVESLTLVDSKYLRSGYGSKLILPKNEVAEENAIYVAQLQELARVFSSSGDRHIRQYIINFARGVLERAGDYKRVEGYIAEMLN